VRRLSCAHVGDGGHDLRPDPDTVSRSRWRWLAAAYPVLTLLVVVVTANHFWLDGIAAGILVALVLVVQRAARGLRSGKSSEGPQVKSVRGEMSVRS
jgi:MFS superfamily sulfate permease-like transporter